MQLNCQTVQFQTIQFSIIHLLFQCLNFKQFYRTLSDATTPSQGEPGSDGNEEVFHIPKIFRTSATPSDCLASYPRHSLGARFTPRQRCSRCTPQPQPTWLRSFECLNQDILIDRQGWTKVIWPSKSIYIELLYYFRLWKECVFLINSMTISFLSTEWHPGTIIVMKFMDVNKKAFCVVCLSKKNSLGLYKI